MLTPTIIILAYCIDIIVGDPRRIPHPVIGIGNSISRLEKWLRVYLSSHLKLGGFFLTILIVLGAYGITWFLLELAYFIHPYLKILLEIWLISTTIAIKGLKQAGMKIVHHLKIGDIPGARYALSMVVGRDTNKLGKQEIARGGIETVAENIVDAITAPLFFAMIGGAPLALAYRATNTLDSMVGYKNERYQDFGFVSAKLDDILNYIPARVTFFIMILSFFILRFPIKKAIYIVVRDAKLHPSPNSGIPESAVAGALGIQLGGRNEYKGVVSHRAKMGDPINTIGEKHIVETIRIMEWTSFFFVVTYFTMYLLLFL